MDVAGGRRELALPVERKVDVEPAVDARGELLRGHQERVLQRGVIVDDKIARRSDRCVRVVVARRQHVVAEPARDLVHVGLTIIVPSVGEQFDVGRDLLVERAGESDTRLRRRYPARVELVVLVGHAGIGHDLGPGQALAVLTLGHGVAVAAVRAGQGEARRGARDGRRVAGGDDRRHGVGELHPIVEAVDRIIGRELVRQGPAADVRRLVGFETAGEVAALAGQVPLRAEQGGDRLPGAAGVLGGIERGLGGQAFVAALEHHVDHPGDGIRAIFRRGAVGQHVDTVHRQLRDDRRVGLAAAVALVGEADAVDHQQGARALLAQVADVDVLVARDIAAAVDDVAVGDHGDVRHRLQQVADGDRAGLLELLLRQRRHRLADGLHAADVGAGHDDLLDGRRRRRGGRGRNVGQDGRRRRVLRPRRCRRYETCRRRRRQQESHGPSAPLAPHSR